MNKIVGLNEKTREMLSELISDLRIESYKQGFEAGRKYETVEGKNGISRVSRLVHDKIRTGERKSPNQQRAELIHKAKEFVEEQKDKKWNDYTVDKHFGCTATFYRKGNRVSCVLRGYSSGIIRATGRSNCNPNDVFNLYIGQAISLARALKIDVPVEFLEAVQPSEVVVGMVANIDAHTSWTVTDKVTSIGDKTLRLKCANENLLNGRVVITDDSNAIYEVQS